MQSTRHVEFNIWYMHPTEIQRMALECKKGMFLFFQFFGFIFSSLCLCQVWTVLASAHDKLHICVLGKLWQPCPSVSVLWGFHVVALVSCHSVVVHLRPKLQHVDGSSQDGPATVNDKPRRCEYVMGLMLHSALTICPLSVWLVVGVSS